MQDELIQRCRHLESLTYGRAQEELVRAAEELCRDGVLLVLYRAASAHAA